MRNDCVFVNKLKPSPDTTGYEMSLPICVHTHHVTGVLAFNLQVPFDGWQSELEMRKQQLVAFTQVIL